MTLTRFSKLLAPLFLILASCTDGGVGPADSHSFLLHLTDQDGAGVPGAVLTLLPSAAPRLIAETDSVGRAIVESVERGDYGLTVDIPQGYSLATALPATISLPEDAVLDARANAILEASITLEPGQTETLHLLGASVVARAPSNGDAVPLVLRIVSDADFELPVLTPIQIITGEGAGSAATRSFPPRHSRALITDASEAAQTGVSLSVLHTIPSSVTQTSGFSALREAGEELTLYAEAEATTVTLPSGTSRRVLAHEIMVAPSGANVRIAAVMTDSRCDGYADTRTLQEIGGTGTIPLVLIHGWQGKHRTCRDVYDYEPAEDVWEQMVPALLGDPDVAAKYRIFVARYPSFEPVLRTSDFLDAEFQTLGLESPVLIGHSMGGLVARGLAVRREYAGRPSDVRAIITLGTPHEGSPLAFRAGPSYFPRTDGVRDLEPSSALIAALKERPHSNVYAFGGEIGKSAALYYSLLSRAMESSKNDGIVPRESAAPPWTLTQSFYEDTDHSQVAKRAEIIGSVRDILSSVASDCAPAPEHVTRNAFSLSGSVARQGTSRTVDVTLNPIVVEGQVIQNIGPENFHIIENGCSRNFAVSTEQGEIGLDIVFIQDLSSSMLGEFNGVKQSVIAFAHQVAENGVNVRLGAVGFTGPVSTIPSLPAGSPAEFIGPVQDFSTADAFAEQVETWHAGDGRGNMDQAENGLEAIEYAHHNLSWRDGAARAYVLISDARQHVAGSNCNYAGPCTDQTAASIAELVGERAAIHAVSPAWAPGIGADPSELADLTGGTHVVLPSWGRFDLTETGLGQTLGNVVRLTYTSSTAFPAVHDLRIRAEITVDGEDLVAELAPRLVTYDILSPSLRRFSPDAP